MNPLAVAITLAAAAPTIAATLFLIIAQMGLGFEVKPEYVVGGIILIFGLTIFILKREAERIFSLIDSVPGVSRDVSTIKDDIGEIKTTVQGLLPWKEDVSRRLGIIEYRLNIEKIGK